jgi:hypothetical protein
VVKHLGLLLALLLIAPAVGAQGLGDAAAREREKREKQAAKKAPREYTNADLRKEEPGKAGEKQPSTSGESEAAQLERERRERQTSKEDTSPGADASEDGGAGTRVAEAQAQVDAAQSAVSSIEAHIRELRDRLNPQSTTYIYGPTGSNSANEEAQARSELNDADRELAEARQALSAAEQALQDARQGRPSRRKE